MATPPQMKPENVVFTSEDIELVGDGPFLRYADAAQYISNTIGISNHRIKFKNVKFIDSFPSEVNEINFTIVSGSPIENKSFRKYSVEGEDELCYRDTSKLKDIITKANEHQIHFIRSPPASGKTTMIAMLKDCLDKMKFRNSSFSFLGTQQSDSWQDLVYSNTNWTWKELLQCEKPFFLLVDEVQIAYTKFKLFFEKLKEAQLNKTCQLRIILFASYGEQSIGGEQGTPCEFSSVADLDCLRLSRKEFEEITQLFEKSKGMKLSPETKGAVYASSAGHPGLIRSIFERLYDRFRQNNDFNQLQYLLSHDFRNRIQGSRSFTNVFDCIAVEKTRNFLWEFIQVESTDGYELIVFELIKKGLLARSDENVTFSSPICKMLCQMQMVKHMITQMPSAETSSLKLKEFLTKTISRMDKSLLKFSRGQTSTEIPLEAAWQMEFYTRAVSYLPMNINISPEVGKVFGIDGRLDFYVNGGKQWGIELTRESSKLQEHLDRFGVNGAYHPIGCLDWVVVDFISESKYKRNKQSGKLLEHENLCYAVYKEDFSSIKVYYLDQDPESLSLRDLRVE